ncbi:hypothetical protein GCM10009624_33500 [Gordonia sinesedis]
MAVAARHYRVLAEALREAGFEAIVVPRRGFADGPEPDSGVNAPGPGTDWGYADEATDLADAVGRARERNPVGDVLVLGHSLGAQLAVLAAADPATPSAQRPDAIVAVGASVPYHRHYPANGLDVAGLAAQVMATTEAEGYWPAPGFGAPAPYTLMRDWASMVRTGSLPGEARLDLPVGVPALTIRLHGDTLVTAGAADRFDALIAPADLTTWTYRSGDGDGSHDGTVDHITWIRTPVQPVAAMRRWWLERRPPR